MSFSVIIPSRNDANLNACVDAIRAADRPCHIIVVDDGLKERRADCEYVDGVKPFIYARNINIGIRAAGDDDVILLNDDALLKTTKGFTKLVAAASQYPELGVVSAAVNNVGNVNQHPRGFGMRTDDRMVCFVAVYIPRRTIETVGLLDEEFTGYGCEDDSYCLRARRAGLKIGIYDHCFVDHSELSSAFRGGPEAGGDFRPNLKIFIEKYGHDNRGLTKEESPFSELFA